MLTTYEKCFTIIRDGAYNMEGANKLTDDKLTNFNFLITILLIYSFLATDFSDL